MEGGSMERWDSLRKIGRNEAIERYAAENPKVSLQEIGKNFGITKQRVHELLKLAESKKKEAAMST